jgi:hypothetical protein
VFDASKEKIKKLKKKNPKIDTYLCNITNEKKLLSYIKKITKK